MSSYVEAARAFAAQAHAGQRYDREPYTVHLDAVDRVLRDLGVEDESLLAAAFLHDVIEDTQTTADDLLRAGFRPETIAWVGMVTNEAGANRRERAARTYPKIRRDPQAVLLKLADRIANAEASRATGNSLFEMYRREHAGFAAALRRPGEWEEAWARLTTGPRGVMGWPLGSIRDRAPGRRSARCVAFVHASSPGWDRGGAARGTWPDLRRPPRSTRPGPDPYWRRYRTDGERPARPRVPTPRDDRSRAVDRSPARALSRSVTPAAVLVTWSRARYARRALQVRPRPRDGSEGRARGAQVFAASLRLGGDHR